METYKRLFIIVVLLTVFGQAADAQVVKNMSLLGNYGKGEGESKAVFAAGSLVYYGLGNKMQIASFSNPTAPVKIGSVVLSDIVEDLVRTSINSNQYIVASGGGRMWIINVQSPTQPVLTADVDVATGTTCEGIATSGTYAYVAAGGSGFRVYNIATPATPVFVASIDSLAYCEAVVVSGQYAYVAAGSRSFVVDISNPAAPVAVSQMVGYGGYHQSINVRSGYVYICNYSVGISIVNVTNPASPVNVKEVPAGDRMAKIVFDGNYAYAAIGDLGMSIFNVTNPASPVFVSTTPTAGRSRSVYYGAVTISGTPTGHIFVSNSTSANGVSGINVSNPASPTTAAFIPAAITPSGIAYTPFYANGKVYVAYGTAGLRIVDVSNPAGPTLISTTPLGGDSRSVVVSGNYAYIAGRDSGVFIVDVTNASSPQKVKSIKTPRSRGITVSGNTLFVAVSDSGMAIIDITNPATASLVKYTGKSVYGENIAISGNVGGITDYSKITFYDMTAPTDPAKKGATGSFKTGNEGFAISGNYAYVPDGDSLKIFNITDLNAPVLVSKIKTGGYGFTATVSGKYCYVASEGTGVRTINISNPSVPVEDGFYDGASQSRGVVSNGKYVYVTEKGDGLAIYTNDLFPAPAITVTKTISLGNVKLTQFKDSAVTITNSGTDTLKITSITSSSAVFTVRPSSMTVPPGQSFMDTIRFAPTVLGNVSASIVVVSNASSSPDSISISGTGISLTAVDDQNGKIPTVYSLSQNYPNPFNPSTTITFGLPETGQTTLEVYNLLGQRVSVIMDQRLQAGTYNFSFNASPLPSGIYLYRLQSNNYFSVRKMMLLK